ncbi:hypothetical protein CASFOL_005560 [Castilleja foliolosa]|uniref:Uncharacterized protein n=1 Tax=Castilleja foliolosa TaxID=1961234 RepID=A0ABD3E506_9LAMI
MTLRSDSRSRARTRTKIRTARRISPCYRHPDEPVTGICASCLRERLSGLDASAAAPNAASPELRRCRSVVPISICEASSSSLNEQRRKSCDVVSSRSSLCNLFDVDDLKSGSEGEARVGSKNVGKNVGLSKVTYTVIESKSEKDNNNNKNNHDEIRVSCHKFGYLNADDVDSDGDINEGEFKTMKEHIDLEFQNKSKKSKDFKEIAGNFLGAASIFTRKLRNWRQSNNTSKTKNHKNGNVRKFGEGHNSEIVGRRSCDTEPRFSVDAGPTPFEEPRASWDGYMIARTIPRLAPMFSVVENGILGNMNKFENRRLSLDGPTMHSIVEDESSSGASGSGHSNSDSSFSMRQSSFDRSSSVRSFGKKAVITSPANGKLVITEKELKDWHLSDGLDKFGPTDKENVGKPNGPAKKPVRWRKVCNVLGFGPKNSESNVNVMDTNGGKLARSTSVVGPRNIPCDVVESNYRRSVDNAGGYDFKLERNTSGKYGSDELGDGTMPVPFYMTPLRSLKHCKSGKFELRKNPLSVDGNVLRLN